MNLRQLRAFVEVADQESFTKAGNRLHLSQPGISWQIRSLENILGTKLFEWHDRQVWFTEAGRFLLPYARQLVALGDDMLLAVEQLKGLMKGHLKLGASIIAGECILPFFLAAFHRMHPGLAVQLEIGYAERVLQWVKDGVADLGVVSTKPAISGLEFSAFMNDELVLILPPGHPLADYASVPPEELNHHPMIMREKGSWAREAIDQKLRVYGIMLDELPITLEFRSTRGIITAVKAGLGYSVASRWATLEAIIDGSVTSRTILGADLKRTLYLVYLQGTEIGPAVRAFSNFLLDHKVQAEIINRFFPEVGDQKQSETTEVNGL